MAAYQLAAALCDDLTMEVETWQNFEKWSLGVQLVRAAGSVGANIAEGSGRWTDADKRHLFLIARGSLYELEHWVERAIHRGLLDRPYLGRIDEARGALTGLLRRPAPSAQLPTPNSQPR
ncbi:MAG: four helix bundle protein [Thermoleophilaceae bacterium]